MTPQVFRGRTLHDAHSAASAVLGAGAVVLTTRRVKRPGISGWLLGAHDVEIAAAAPPPPEPEPSPLLRRPRAIFAAGVTAEIEDDRESPRDLRPPARPALSVSAMEREIAALRGAVERLSDADLPRSGAVGRLLRETGIEGKAAEALIKALKGAGPAPAADAITDALASLIRVTAWPLAAPGPQVIALVGPSGVGKTTTAAKLAAHARLHLGKSVSFVTCDATRVGAFEQIERYAELLDVPVSRAGTAAEVSRAVASADADLVIVDTAGRGPGAPDSPERALGKLGEKTVRAPSVLLCLPAAVRAADAARFARSFACTRPTALAVTKLDETVTPAGLVHGVAAAEVPASVLCFGLRVPEDIAPATAGAVLDYLLPRRAGRPRGS